jgi:hypothetical protein
MKQTTSHPLLKEKWMNVAEDHVYQHLTIIATLEYSPNLLGLEK